jgi:hypothetical protein
MNERTNGWMDGWMDGRVRTTVVDKSIMTILSFWSPSAGFWEQEYVHDNKTRQIARVPAGDSTLQKTLGALCHYSKRIPKDKEGETLQCLQMGEA